MLDKLKRLDILQCPECQGQIRFFDDYLECQICLKKVPIENGIPLFSKHEIDTKGNYTTEEKRILKKIKDKYPFLADVSSYIRLPSLSFLTRGENPLDGYLKRVLKNPDAVIIDIGSGGSKISPEVISLDIYNYPGVDLCANADKICFKDNSVDLVISSSSLEHMINSADAIKEMDRILKPGGIIFVSVPFINPYHPEPVDLQRWSAEGLKKSFPRYACLEAGGLNGPHQTMHIMLSSYFGWMFSFGQYPIYLLLSGLFQWFFLPFKLLDCLRKNTQNPTPLDSNVYYVGQKTG